MLAEHDVLSIGSFVSRAWIFKYPNKSSIKHDFHKMDMPLVGSELSVTGVDWDVPDQGLRNVASADAQSPPSPLHPALLLKHTKGWVYSTPLLFLFVGKRHDEQ